MKPENASRKFVDLIYQASTKYPNWDPPRPIRVGDYGVIDRKTGGFERAGSIYDESFAQYLPDARRKYPPQAARPERSMIVTSKVESYTEVKLKASGGLPGVVDAGLGGHWCFGASSRGAVLVIDHPRSTFLSWDPSPDALLAIPPLKDKSLVTAAVTCHAYALYLSSGTKDEFSLALTATSAASPAGGSFSTEWRKESGAGFYRNAVDPESELTPLFTLKKVKKRPWYKRRDNRSPERRGLDLLADSKPPWEGLDEDGEEDDYEI